LEVVASKWATTAEMVLILSQQDKDATNDEGNINGVYSILATTFADMHMKDRGLARPRTQSRALYAS